MTVHIVHYLAYLYLHDLEGPWELPSFDYLDILCPEVVVLCVGGNSLVSVVPTLHHVDHLVLPKPA